MLVQLAAYGPRRMLRIDEGSRGAVGGQHSPVTVSCLDRGPIKDEDDKQQTEAPFQVGAMVLNCLR